MQVCTLISYIHAEKCHFIYALVSFIFTGLYFREFANGFSCNVHFKNNRSLLTGLYFVVLIWRPGKLSEYLCRYMQII